MGNGIFRGDFFVTNDLNLPVQCVINEISPFVTFSTSAELLAQNTVNSNTGNLAFLQNSALPPGVTIPTFNERDLNLPQPQQIWYSDPGVLFDNREEASGGIGVFAESIRQQTFSALSRSIRRNGQPVTLTTFRLEPRQQKKLVFPAFRTDLKGICVIVPVENFPFEELFLDLSRDVIEDYVPFEIAGQDCFFGTEDFLSTVQDEVTDCTNFCTFDGNGEVRANPCDVLAIEAVRGAGQPRGLQCKAFPLQPPLLFQPLLQCNPPNIDLENPNVKTTLLVQGAARLLRVQHFEMEPMTTRQGLFSAFPRHNLSEFYPNNIKSEAFHLLIMGHDRDNESPRRRRRLGRDLKGENQKCPKKPVLVAKNGEQCAGECFETKRCQTGSLCTRAPRGYTQDKNYRFCKPKNTNVYTESSRNAQKALAKSAAEGPNPRFKCLSDLDCSECVVDFDASNFEDLFQGRVDEETICTELTEEEYCAFLKDKIDAKCFNSEITLTYFDWVADVYCARKTSLTLVCKN